MLILIPLTVPEIPTCKLANLFTVDHIFQAARTNLSLQKMEEIKYAVLEKDGSLSSCP
jgi:uncharacterized membrane protein YcaP (DUF421 family)